MNSTSAPSLARSAAERLLPFLFDRATLEGVECQDSGWDEWDACVAEQDLRDSIEAQLAAA
jgi:hypothetical protein